MLLKIIDQKENQDISYFESDVNYFMDQMIVVNVKIHNLDGMMRAIILYKNGNS